MTRYAIVDLSNLFFRARHAVRGDAFTKSGLALHVIFQSLKKIYKDRKIDHVVFACDSKSWRYEYFLQYKAKRKLDNMSKTKKELEEDEVFFETMNSFITFVQEKTKCTILKEHRVEGDDFVARWIQLHPNDEHIIVSGDSDFVQLLEDNVHIYDGVKGHFISKDGITDINGNKLVFSVDGSTGKIKIKGTLSEETKKHDKAEKQKAKLKNNYTPIPFSFSVEKDWWKKALFIKCVRGDSGDGIFSAFPGARYEGSSKKVGIKEAWNDRVEMGFHWNNFMLQKWNKLIEDENGKTITKDVKVIDEYKFNEMLIDLTKQPDEIKQIMDNAIVKAVQKEPIGNVGIHFLKFCSQHELLNVQKEAAAHAQYLNAAYSG